jgi:hypothetical protein
MPGSIGRCRRLRRRGSVLSRHDFLSPSAGEGAAPFYAYLGNSTLQNVPIAVAVDFVPAATHAVDSPPNIFLFIIDSLPGLPLALQQRRVVHAVGPRIRR